ncbi:hypothetical protein [Olivibacter sitiensis]|uniref:hypothetical protein n=1 Tax=Olivibacter sitiensis TaxID=376470 RepID=UPI00048122EB|nr:hypothetical protein [Olivibacter sitiensis]
MKHISFFFTVLFLAACPKNDIGPMGLKHGQEAEVSIDHRYWAINDRPLLLPNRQPSEYSLHGFNEREPGYTYRVRAKVHIDKNDPPIQDAIPYWLDFMEVISEEKYAGNEPFEIALIQSHVPGGPVIMLREYDGQYHFIPEKLTLTHADEKVREQLEEIWQHNEEILQSYITDGVYIEPKWKSIRATVTHDPENFGKAYLVSHIEFTE